jgi:hypothetical protein
VACVTTAKLELQFAISEILQKIRMERFAANSRYATKITSLESDIQQQPACWVPLHPSTIYLPKSSPKKNNSLCSRGWWAVSPGGAAYMMPMMPMMPHDAHVNHLSSCSSRPVFDVFCTLSKIVIYSNHSMFLKFVAQDDARQPILDLRVRREDGKGLHQQFDHSLCRAPE